MSVGIVVVVVQWEVESRSLTSTRKGLVTMHHPAQPLRGVVGG